MKYAVREKLLNKLDKLKKIHEDLPKEMHRFGPHIPEINETEFPEKLLVPQIVLPEEEEISADTTTKPLFVPVSEKMCL